jgi:hypothetical protein
MGLSCCELCSERFYPGDVEESEFADELGMDDPSYCGPSICYSCLRTVKDQEKIEKIRTQKGQVLSLKTEVTMLRARVAALEKELKLERSKRILGARNSDDEVIDLGEGNSDDEVIDLGEGNINTDDKVIDLCDDTMTSDKEEAVAKRLKLSCESRAEESISLVGMS